MEILNEYHKKGKVNELVKKMDFEEIVISLNESMEIVDIYTQLNDVKSDSIRRKLELIVKGPILTKEENINRGTNIARNTFYELYTMAVLKRSGFEILFNNPSDVSCTID